MPKEMMVMHMMQPTEAMKKEMAKAMPKEGKRAMKQEKKKRKRTIAEGY